MSVHSSYDQKAVASSPNSAMQPFLIHLSIMGLSGLIMMDDFYVMYMHDDGKQYQ